MVQRNTEQQLRLPAELHDVPEGVLKGFLARFAHCVAAYVSPRSSLHGTQALFESVYTSLSSLQQPGPRLVFRHVCRHTACASPSCQLCSNNPHKACHPSQCLDQQYWVRDDARGGQVVKAKCGADVVVQLFQGSDPQPLQQAGVQVKLYVIPAPTSGEEALPPLAAPVKGLHLSDEGRPLWAVPGMEPGPDGGLDLGPAQEGGCGPGWPLPDKLQFLDKNSTFRTGGRRLEGFRLLARAVQYGAPDSVGRGATAEVVLAQVASAPFKVTTKKAYDSCRKEGYLYATQPFTDRTLPNLGAALVNNLKAVFGGLDTVGDLVGLVEAAARHPPTCHQLREVLNMGRNADKWTAFCKGLQDRVLQEDDTPRLWWLPAASPAAVEGPEGGGGDGPSPSPEAAGCCGVGLVWAAHRGGIDLGTPTGVVVQHTSSHTQLKIGRITAQLQEVAGPQLAQLQQLAGDSWRLPGHPGWRLVTEGLEWISLDSQQVVAAADSALAGTPPPGQRLAAMPSPSSPSQAAATGDIITTSGSSRSAFSVPSNSPKAEKCALNEGPYAVAAPDSAAAGLQEASHDPSKCPPPTPTCNQDSSSPVRSAASATRLRPGISSVSAPVPRARGQDRAASGSSEPAVAATSRALPLAGSCVPEARLRGREWPAALPGPGLAWGMLPPAKRRRTSRAATARRAAATMLQQQGHDHGPFWHQQQHQQQLLSSAVVGPPYSRPAMEGALLPAEGRYHPLLPVVGAPPLQQQVAVLPTVSVSGMPQWVLCDMQQQQQQAVYPEGGTAMQSGFPSAQSSLGGGGACWAPVAGAQHQQQWQGCTPPSGAADMDLSGHACRGLEAVASSTTSHVAPGAGPMEGPTHPAAVPAAAGAGYGPQLHRQQQLDGASATPHSPCAPTAAQQLDQGLHCGPLVPGLQDAWAEQGCMPFLIPPGSTYLAAQHMQQYRTW